MNTEPGDHPNFYGHHPNNKISLKLPKTSVLVQPMVRGNMGSFAADYLQQTSERLIKDVDNEDEPTIKELYKV